MSYPAVILYNIIWKSCPCGYVLPHNLIILFFSCFLLLYVWPKPIQMTKFYFSKQKKLYRNKHMQNHFILQAKMYVWVRAKTYNILGCTNSVYKCFFFSSSYDKSIYFFTNLPQIDTRFFFLFLSLSLFFFFNAVERPKRHKNNSTQKFRTQYTHFKFVLPLAPEHASKHKA